MYRPLVMMSPALSFEMNRKKRSNGSFVSSSILYSIRSLYIIRECLRVIFQATSGLWSPFLHNINPNSLPTLLTKMCPMSVLKNSRPDSAFPRKISTLCLLRDTLIVIELPLWFVIVFFPNENVHGSNKIRIGRVDTWLQIVKFRRLWKIFIKKHSLSLSSILVRWRVWYFRIWNLPLTFQI